MKSNQFPESAELLRRALDGFVRIFGRVHQRSLICMRYLAQALNSQEKYEETEQLYRQTFEGYRGEYGADHPATIESKCSAAKEDMKRRRRCIEEYLKTMEGCWAYGIPVLLRALLTWQSCWRSRRHGEALQIEFSRGTEASDEEKEQGLQL